MNTRILASTTPPEAEQYLLFSLGGEQYAVGILQVREIIEFGELTEVPMMPDFVRGIINLRGAVVPVVDLQARFGRPRTGVDRRTCIVIVELADAEAGQQVIGVMVDTVNAVVDIPPQDIEPPPAFGAHIRPDFILGMGRLDGQFVILLRLEAALSLEDMSRIVAGKVDALAGGERLAIAP